MGQLFHEREKRLAEQYGVDYSGVRMLPIDLTELTRLWGAASAYVNLDSYGGPQDFMSILYVRDELDDVAKSAEPGLRDRLAAWLAHADAAYMAATTPDDRHLWSDVHEMSSTDGWWWCRVPLTGPLRDLLERGIPTDPIT